MSTHRGPRHGTRPHNALYKLHLLGGSASMTNWMNSICWDESIPVFKREIVGCLRAYDLVELDGETCLLTESAGDFLGIDRDELAGRVPAMAGPRYAPGRGALSEKHMVRGVSGRPGAFDYRDIPSRIGSERVPFVPGKRTSSTGSK